MAQVFHTLMALTLLLTFAAPAELLAGERERLHFFTRIGAQQIDADAASLDVSVSNGTPSSSLLPSNRPLDIGAGMLYRREGLHLQIGPLMEWGQPSMLTPQQKVFVEGQIGVYW